LPFVTRHYYQKLYIEAISPNNKVVTFCIENERDLFKIGVSALITTEGSMPW